MIRFSRLKEQKPTRFSGGYIAKDLLPLINEKVAEARQKFSATYQAILQEMEENNIYLLNETQLNEEQKTFCREYFSNVISPHLVPLMLRKSMHIPFLNDNKIYLAVRMSMHKKSRARYAILQIPVTSGCPRFIVLPSANERKEIIFIDDIIHLCLDEIFFMFNYEEITAHTFKIMRDALLTIDDDISKSVIEKMEDGIQNREHGDPVSLIYDHQMPEDLLETLAGKLKLRNRELITPGGRYHLLRDLMKFPSIRRELENVNHPPISHPAVQLNSSIFQVIKKQDILLNYPYHTFNHLIDFLREAAIDPHVERICITLYRTADHSKVINALVNAVKNGKEVIVLLELLARFDEEQNIENSERLQREGIKIVHGIPGIKVHSKLVLVEHRGKANQQGFVYIGTGNFNESTARIYEDFGLFTSHPQIVADTRAVFDFLQNTHKHFKCRQLLVSPYDMRDQFTELITKETALAAKGKPAFIYAKFNSLTDERIIQLLYEAGQAGVDICLIVRGSCTLQAQVPGLSENIRVISIVDKYLEHARVVIFHQGGKNKTFIGSADWMTRNLDRRVEIITPVLDKKIKKTLIDFFRIQWADNVKARIQDKEGTNQYVEAGKNPPLRSQEALYEYYKNMTQETQ